MRPQIDREQGLAQALPRLYERGGYCLVRPFPDAIVIELIGEHDLATSPELREVLASVVAANNLVVADLSATKFIDSSGLLAVAKAHRQADQDGVEFRLQLGAPAIVRRILEISNTLERIPCFPTREEALARG